MAALLLSLLFFGVVALVYIYIVNHGGSSVARTCFLVSGGGIVALSGRDGALT